VRRMGHDIAIGMMLDVTYRRIAIGDKEFILPERALETAAFGKSVTKSELTFDRYHKYDSSSDIRFDDGTQKPEESDMIPQL